LLSIFLYTNYNTFSGEYTGQQRTLRKIGVKRIWEIRGIGEIEEKERRKRREKE